MTEGSCRSNCAFLLVLDVPTTFTRSILLSCARKSAGESLGSTALVRTPGGRIAGQVAILATGNIEKKPAVIETPSGDAIAIRHIIMLSLTHDHRIVDGVLGGSFLRRIADLLEGFDGSRTI